MKFGANWNVVKLYYSTSRRWLKSVEIGRNRKKTKDSTQKSRRSPILTGLSRWLVVEELKASTINIAGQCKNGICSVVTANAIQLFIKLIITIIVSNANKKKKKKTPIDALDKTWLQWFYSHVIYFVDASQSLTYQNFRQLIQMNKWKSIRIVLIWIRRA